MTYKAGFMYSLCKGLGGYSRWFPPVISSGNFLPAISPANLSRWFHPGYLPRKQLHLCRSLFSKPIQASVKIYLTLLSTLSVVSHSLLAYLPSFWKHFTGLLCPNAMQKSNAYAQLFGRRASFVHSDLVHFDLPGQSSRGLLVVPHMNGIYNSSFQRRCYVGPSIWNHLPMEHRLALLAPSLSSVKAWGQSSLL